MRDRISDNTLQCVIKNIQFRFDMYWYYDILSYSGVLERKLENNIELSCMCLFLISRIYTKSTNKIIKSTNQAGELRNI